MESLVHIVLYRVSFNIFSILKINIFNLMLKRKVVLIL